MYSTRQPHVWPQHPPAATTAFNRRHASRAGIGRTDTHPRAKKQMRTLYLYGMTARELAEHFGVFMKIIDAALGKFTRKRG